MIWKKVLATAGVAVATLTGAVYAVPAGASSDVNVDNEWFMGGAFTRATDFDETECGSGIWMRNRATSGSFQGQWFLALPASCVYNFPGALSAASEKSKFFRTGDSFDSTGNWFNPTESGSTPTVFRPTGATYGAYNLMLIRFEDESVASKFMLNWCAGGGTKCAGSANLTGNTSNHEGDDFYEQPSRFDWYEAGPTIDGATACKGSAWGGTACGTVNTGSSTFTQVTDGIPADWASPVKSITFPTSYCGVADGDNTYTRNGVHDAGAAVYLRGHGEGGGTYADQGGQQKYAIAGILLGPASKSQANDTACWANTFEERGYTGNFMTTDTIWHVWHDLLGFDLQPIDDDEDPTAGDDLPWEDVRRITTTYTIGNKAIPGTNYNVSCWQVFNWQTYGPGVSVLNCTRYYNPTGAAVTSDSYTLPTNCSGLVNWDATINTARLLVSNSNGVLEPKYPYVGRNEFDTGCYKGTDQNGSAAWYRAVTETTSTCRMSPLTSSSCSITNLGNEGGSWWNSPGVSRDTWARGSVGAPASPPGPADCSQWPSGCSIFSRIIYTQ
jgi:hypothetical protein